VDEGATRAAAANASSYDAVAGADGEAAAVELSCGDAVAGAFDGVRSRMPGGAFMPGGGRSGADADAGADVVTHAAAAAAAGVEVGVVALKVEGAAGAAMAELLLLLPTDGDDDDVEGRDAAALLDCVVEGFGGRVNTYGTNRVFDEETAEAEVGVGVEAEAGTELLGTGGCASVASFVVATCA